jgi:hypothetical protein
MAVYPAPPIRGRESLGRTASLLNGCALEREGAFHPVKGLLRGITEQSKNPFILFEFDRRRTVSLYMSIRFSNGVSSPAKNAFFANLHPLNKW